jgi:hypothetical protein
MILECLFPEDCRAADNAASFDLVDEVVQAATPSAAKNWNNNTVATRRQILNVGEALPELDVLAVGTWHHPDESPDIATAQMWMLLDEFRELRPIADDVEDSLG